MTNPTSGAWTFTPEYSRVYGKTPSGHPISVCVTSARNGHLIAAAPELLEALKGLIDYAAREIGIDPAEAVGGYFKPARDAIAKAEGRQ